MLRGRGQGYRHRFFRQRVSNLLVKSPQLQALHKRMDDMVVALTEQVKITQHIANTLQEIFLGLLSLRPWSIHLRLSQEPAYIDTVRALAEYSGKIGEPAYRCGRLPTYHTSLIDCLCRHPPTPEAEDSMEAVEEATPKRTKTSQQTIPYNDDLKSAQDDDEEMREERRMRCRLMKHGVTE